jgi:hypothetical protein
MTAASDDPRGFDPDGTAEDEAVRAFKRILRFRTAGVLAVAATLMSLVAAEYVFGVMALPLTAWWTSDLLAVFIAAEAYFTWGGYLRARAKRRSEAGHLAEGERQLAALDRLRAREVPAPWWRQGPRSFLFWRGLVIRAVYSACAEVVLAHFFGLAAGTAGAAAFTAAFLVLRPGSDSVMARYVTAVSFIDPRPPRDSPEC